MKRVLVTGANGFVGRFLCALLSERGWQVRGTVRHPKSFPSLPKNVAPIATGDIESFQDWHDTLGDVDAIVHLVARTHVMRDQASNPLELYRSVNVRGTQRLLEGCRRTNVKRFVFVSSIKAVGERSEKACEEIDACMPETPYGQTKLEAERLLLDAAGAMGIAPVILRPPLVYGAGVPGNFLRMLRAVDLGIPLPCWSIKNRRSLVYVGNLASAIAECLEHPNATGEVFHVADNLPVSTSELISEMASALGKKERLLPTPVSMIRAAGYLTGRQDEVSRLLDSLTLSTEKIKRRIGWEPGVSLKEGLDATVRQYRIGNRSF
ncbi:3 beta-hydroxysteroid dehydrogenase/Delta 5--_4-isomerase [Rosistilla carotiformis]|uniref:3 beta-hydroxysteroid dehydrogenase/Delta 5-->4-isomerase n=1 Tax=Rosistilla carotiformis TaxID=2528017 RepID=A0A518JNY6_9BACT|nr:NAD-dependent epimerase/dehydratase family protein [Rosistilla carotiformis]QDV67262.1 3 beta-hydroxysteroid dehydrogenase/Delta 5-->4-isomerase [Rosistilla carotiformis]